MEKFKIQPFRYLFVTELSQISSKQTLLANLTCNKVFDPPDKPQTPIVIITKVIKKLSQFQDNS